MWPWPWGCSRPSTGENNIVVTNRSSEHVSLHLDGAAETLRLRCRPTHLDVAPGDIKTAKLRVRAKPRLLDAIDIRCRSQLAAHNFRSGPLAPLTTDQ